MAKDGQDNDIRGLSERIVEAETYFKSVDEQDEADYLMRNLCWQERLFLVQRFWRGWSLKRIAKTHNMTRHAVSEKLKEIIEKIQKGVYDDDENKQNDN